MDELFIIRIRYVSFCRVDFDVVQTEHGRDFRLVRNGDIKRENFMAFYGKDTRPISINLDVGVAFKQPYKNLDKLKIKAVKLRKKFSNLIEKKIVNGSKLFFRLIEKSIKKKLEDEIFEFIKTKERFGFKPNVTETINDILNLITVKEIIDS